MSKTGKSNFVYHNPSSSIQINGQDKAGVNINPSGTSGYYNMNDDEKQAYEYAQKQFALNLPKLDVFSADSQRKMDNQVKTFINAGKDDINEVYKPMLQDLQNDVASRFGNLDNSVFMDNLGKIEDKRSDAVSELAQNTELFRQDLTNNELANRYQYLDYMNNYQQQVLGNVLNMLGTGQNLSNASNSYYNNLNNNIANGNAAPYNYNSLLNMAFNKALGMLPFGK